MTIIEPGPQPTGVPTPVDVPDDDNIDRAALAAQVRLARQTNLADIAQAEQIIATSTNPAIVALAQHSKAQALQLNALIRLLVWQLRKSDSSL